MASRFQPDELIAAINRHDVEAVIKFYRENTIVHDPAYPEPLRGREAVGKDTADFFTAFPDLRFTLRGVVESGEMLAVEILGEGTHTGELAGPSGPIAPTGRSMSLPIGVFDKIDDQGLIVEERRYYDLAGLLRQLGQLGAAEQVVAV